MSDYDSIPYLSFTLLNAIVGNESDPYVHDGHKNASDWDPEIYTQTWVVSFHRFGSRDSYGVELVREHHHGA